MAGTMQEIADITGVSRGTVDRVLNHRGKVREEVAQQVREAARQVGYLTKTERKEERARKYLATHAVARKIGVVTQLSGASFMLSIRQGYEEKDGRITGTVSQNGGEMAANGLNAAVILLNGEELESNTLITTNTWIDAENVADYE